MLNPSFIAGFGHKSVLGFAAGGFVLLNRQRDFVDTFGDAGEAVSYSTADELAGKIDLYLTKPTLRREIGGVIREKLFARHTLQATLARVLEQAAAELGAARTRRPHRRSGRRFPSSTCCRSSVVGGSGRGIRIACSAEATGSSCPAMPKTGATLRGLPSRSRSHG